MYIKEAILLCYIVSIALSVAGLTCCILSNGRQKTGFSKTMIGFMGCLLAVCFYDMTIYYSNYVLGILSNMEVMRIGNCIIAGAMCLWILVQQQIIERSALKTLNRMAVHYMIFYGCIWLVLTIALTLEQFYTLKWLLLATDIVLIILFLAVCVAHIVYAAVAGEKMNVYYMTLITGLLLWNYISYFWSETSVYWGNSGFIRAPMDLTIIVWLVITAVNLVYAYRKLFTPAFGREDELSREAGASPGDAVDTGPQAGVGPRKSLEVRIEEVREQYHLTPREKEFVELIYRGKSNKEIAEMLFLSESTVKTHIYNIFRKMDVKNRVSVICIINEEANASAETIVPQEENDK